MPPDVHKEKVFEQAIEEHLLASGYLKRSPAHFDQDVALDSDIFFRFIESSQPKKWEKISKIHGSQVRAKVLQRLTKEIAARGMLEVLRHGIDDYGAHFDMAYVLPASGMNQGVIEQYEKNILTVTRQVKYKKGSDKSLDIVIGVNGFPLITAELKNPLTGQNFRYAIHQYRKDRDPKELLFQFNRRALVHFAVDPDEVYMTTRLEGEHTRFLPFNKGRHRGAGNPDNPKGYRTSYLWEEVLQKDSLMDILGHFVQLERKETKEAGVVRKTESIIFPRYHQMDVVRKIVADSRKKGAGQSYLVEHSAGSGKSNSIGWVAHRLASLHSEADEPVFDSVVVITDRQVLDQQLQDTIYQFEHKQGVVQKIDKDSAQLADNLKKGTRIIVTTIQKFPFVLGLAGNLPDRKYALIVDEAHSSQTGELAGKVRMVLAAHKSLEEAAAAEAEEEEKIVDYEDIIRKQMAARGRLKNVSFFAFTATPKAKTIELFGTPGPDGKPVAFHLYSMRQAIEEEFILDVLENYTTYKTYFDLTKKILEDPELDKKKAVSAIARFVSLHPHNLAQKTEIILEHFRQFVRHKINGKAKAMVVTSSRLHAVRYKQEFDRYIAEKKYDDIKTLVAFSGKVIDGGIEYTESGFNKFSETQLPEKFDTNEYQVLLVANKYQTGYDQPLLHTMYVEKKLSGVRAVQTLSRLNRTCPGKEDTFVLDFVNEPEVIQKAFQPYYDTTLVSETTDPNLAYDLKNECDKAQIYWQSEVEGFCKAFFLADPKDPVKTHAELYARIQPAVDRFKALDNAKQKEFYDLLSKYVRLYSYLALLSPVSDVRLEMLFTYGRFLLRYITDGSGGDPLKLDDDVALLHYRLQKKFDGGIQLMPGEVELPPSWMAGSSGKGEVTKEKLSTIIDLLNDRFKPEKPFGSTDQLFFDQIVDNMAKDEGLAAQAEANPIENYRFGFDDKWDENLIDLMENNQALFERIINDPDFGAYLKGLIMEKVYRKQRTSVDGGILPPAPGSRGGEIRA
jgi:type I restriction enzyme, R subunit